ncbi:MAG: hypothetical protein HC936_16605 [Leptolyngbyaceae cyanobacterium SU_3_3]|nr:hypothetical protein [Leptolyngbyaceae cyanobacterium SU_3_3]
MGVLCYQTYNRQVMQLTIEQIQSAAGIPRDKIKPVLSRLLRRSWVISDGVFYQLALKQLEIHPVDDSAIAYDAMLGIRPPRPKPNLLYPEGPWLTENGLLNEDFIHDRAQVWRTGDHPQAKSFSALAIEDVMGVVCKYYAKPTNHASLEIDWQSYCLKNRRYLTNIQQRIESGATIAPSEQTTVLNKLPSAMQAAQPVYEAPLLPGFPPIETPPERAIAEDAPPIMHPQMQTLIAAKAAPTNQSGRDPLDAIEKLKLWLSDPILRPEAERLAQAKGYQLEYDEQGAAIGLRVGEAA